MDNSPTIARPGIPFAGVTPRLGFGCAHLYTGRERAQSLRLLETALDCGVTYFDTARLYGHGESEGLLGSVMGGRRDQLFIATKAGILPTPNSPAQRFRDRAARALRNAPPLRRLVQEPLVPQPTFGAFGSGQVLDSLATSLRALRTDYVDLLLLHECRPEDAADPALLEALTRMVEQGKVRAWGVATDVDSTIAIAQAAPPGMSVLQVPHSVVEPNLARVRAAAALPVVTHSSLGSSLSRLAAALRENDLLRTSCRALGLDPDDVGALARRLLAASLADNPDGVVLFSARTPDQIASNFAAQSVPPSEVAALAQLLDQHLALQ